MHHRYLGISTSCAVSTEFKMYSTNFVTAFSLPTPRRLALIGRSIESADLDLLLAILLHFSSVTHLVALHDGTQIRSRRNASWPLTMPSTTCMSFGKRSVFISTIPCTTRSS